MAKSETAAAKEWITGLAPGTWFWSRDIPGHPKIAGPVLSRLHADEASGVWKVARGLYWRGFPEGHDYFRLWPDYEVGALLLAGPGAGLAGWSALHSLMWTLQRPVKGFVSALGRPPVPPDPTIVYKPSRNKRRADLNWTEVTVLEALGLFWVTEEPWHECLEGVRNSLYAERLRWDPTIRPEKLQWAAEAEEGVTVETLHRVGEIVQVVSASAEAA